MFLEHHNTWLSYKGVSYGIKNFGLHYFMFPVSLKKCE